MMRSFVALAAAAVVVALPSRAQDPAEAAFDEGFTAAQALMQRGKWSDAQAAFDQLLSAHNGKLYAIARREELAHDLRECRFRAVAVAPKLEDMLKGKVASFSDSSGKLKLVYEGTFDDWEGEEDILWHPVVFAGSYSVTVSGRYYPPDGISMIFDSDPSGDEFFFARFGWAQENRGGSLVNLPALIEHGTGEHLNKLAEGSSKAKRGEPYQVVLKVAPKSVELVADKKSIVKCKRDAADLGQVALFKSNFESVVLEGKVEPSWYQGMVDTELARQRARFDESYDESKVLPKWLSQRPAGKRTAAAHDSWMPGSGLSEQAAAMLQLWQEGQRAPALEALRKLGDNDAEPVTRQFLEANLLLQLGHPEQALKLSEALLADGAGDSRLRRLHAEVLDGLGRADDSLAQLRAALAADPGEADVYEALVVTLLRRREVEAAAKVVRDGKVQHGLWDELAGVDRMLTMARRGPAFARRYSAESQHYEVVSDIDERICREACKLLETSYVNLKAQFASIKDAKSSERMRVFLFSGESGYQDYNKAILGNAVPHTAGLYTPVLKQLLIWNLPKREDMERTIRHEGFHQFLDQVMADPPTWLNEGTAEYWETAARESGRLKGGQVRRDHLATLARSRKALPTLQQFVYGARSDFYANATLRYAQAWALVHFLREGGRDNEARYEALFRALRTEGSTRAALDGAFKGVDWAAFEKKFWEHLGGLK